MTRKTPLAWCFPLTLVLIGAGCGNRTAPTPASAEPEASRTVAPTNPTDVVTLSAAAIAEAGITTWTVQAMQTVHRLALNGSVGPNENRFLEVAANVRGRVTEIPVDLGARVKRGQPIARIESVELGKAREELIRALAEARVAALSSERARTLLEAKAISEGEFQLREGELLALRAKADAAERTLHLLGDNPEWVHRVREGLAAPHDPYPSAGEGATLVLRAPFDGRVIDRKVTPGALFEALQPLISVADLTTVWVFFQAYEKDLHLLREGQRVAIGTEAFPQETFSGLVDFVGSVVDPQTRTLKLRATVANPAERVRPGMFVRALVEVPSAGHDTPGAVLVPEVAVQTMDEGSVVFVQTAPGVFAKRVVEVGHTLDGHTEVLAGLTLGEVVVTEGSFVLKSELSRGLLAEED